ncbi:MAG: M14 family zinc carboxypeptidase [Caldicoprobacterales bacterium]|jgi:hypothetical protein
MIFNSFFNYHELINFLTKTAEQHPHLFTMKILAETNEGNKIYCMEVTDKFSHVPDDYKSGFYIQGNLHALEFAGSMQCVYFINYITENYESDPRLRRLLKERIFYIVPRVAVDGTEYILNTHSALRCKHIEHEDQPIIKKDLNNDGRILTMRWKSPYGSFRISDSDHRLMIPIDPLEDVDPDSRYMLAVEGLLNVGVKENHLESHYFKYGGDNLDFNRNFPVNWKRISGTNTGKYPLSELETRAIADFIIDHPDIIQVIDFHTGNPAIFYPNLLGKHNKDYADDWNIVETIGKKGEELLGFKLLSGYSEETTGSHAAPLPGCFKDWLYEDRGIIPYIIELGLFYNFLGVPRFSQYSTASECEEVTGLALLKWHDSHKESDLFFDWQTFTHPQLGEVEIGGWNWIKYSNPPLDEMDDICRRCTEFILEMAEWRPRIEINDVQIKKIEDSIFKIRAMVINNGKLNSSVTKMRAEKNPSKTFISIENDEGIEYISGNERVQIQEMLSDKGFSETEWVIRTRSKKACIKLLSKTGIYDEKKIDLC